MRKAWRCCLIGLLLTAVPGCGDSPQILVHDMLVFWNEVCDNILRANDNATAKELVDVQFKILEKKHEKIKDRFEKRFRDLDKATAKELDNALLDYYYEIRDTNARVTNTLKRLDAVIQANRDKDTTSLA